MTGLLRALWRHLDDWASRRTDPIVQAALSTSPDRARQPVVPAPRRTLDAVWSHCRCCRSFSAPQPCPIVHRTPCDKPTCGQWTVTELTSCMSSSWQTPTRPPRRPLTLTTRGAVVALIVVFLLVWAGSAIGYALTGVSG